MISRFTVIFVCFLFLFISAAHAVEQLPVESFAQLPRMQQAQLSPDGQRIAALLNVENETLLITRKVFGKDLSVILKSDNKQLSISWIRWLNDERVAVSVRFPHNRYGVATMETRLLSIRFDGSEAISLMDASSLKVPWVPQFQDQVIDWLPDDERHILMLADLEKPGSTGVYRVDVNTGKRKRLKKSQDGVFNWITDQQHRVRVKVAMSGKEFTVSFCDPEESSWKKAWVYQAFSDQEITPIGFGLDPNVLYVLANRDGRKAVFSVDLLNPELPLVLKYGDQKFDVEGSLIHSDMTGEAIGILSRYGDRGPIYWDSAYLEVVRGIDKMMPETRNSILGFSRSEKHFLVSSVSDTQPGVIYFGDRNGGQLMPIGRAYPDLPQEQMAGRKPVQFKARDGVDIPAYLSLPKVGGQKNLPTVVLLHDGTSSRVDLDFDYWTEFLANRGYVVLQMDLRGSSGYGSESSAKGFKEWSSRIQNDMGDGVQWLMDSGITDKQRVCVVGAGYGGYSALMAATTGSPFFRCAASFAGVSDLRNLVASKKNYNTGALAEENIGHVWDDSEKLNNGSPRLLADKISIPILLMHGTQDRSVPFEQSELMASALKSAGKPYRFVEFEGGDHYLSRYENRLLFLRELESFLNTHLDVASANVKSASQGLSAAVATPAVPPSQN